EVAPMRRLTEVYGFHAAALDIRQNSAFHGVAIGQLLTIAGMDGSDYLNWPEDRKRELIDRELGSPRPFAVSSAALPPEAEASVAVLRLAREWSERHGSGGGGAVHRGLTAPASAA